MTRGMRRLAQAGESNLKIRRPVDIQADMPTSATKAKQLLGILSCEPPNSDLHNFIGNFAYQPVAGAPSLSAQGLMRASASPQR